MSRDVLLGAGGGGGGSYRNRPDNLRSTDTFEALVGISSSRTKLAPGGLKNLYLNGVPVEDGQGNASFKDFSALLFDGNPATLTPVMLRLGQSAGQTQVNLTLSNTYTNGAPGDWRNASITTPGVDFIDLRFVVQSLYRQTKDGVFDQTASIEIELQPSGTSTWINPLLDVTAPPYSPDGFLGAVYRIFATQNMWANPLNYLTPSWAETAPGKMAIQGKTTSPYVKEVRIAVPNTGAYANKTWSVRCRLVENDYAVSGENGENEYRRTIVWDSIAGVSGKEIGGTEAWRGVSHLTIYGKATDQISGIPEMTGIYDLGEHRVPPSSVWDPTTRVYTGATWDGVTSQVAWTQCPAFQIKGLIEDDLSGVSALAPGSTLNKWDALEASKWFAELVPDGKGGYHPRYSANWFLEQPMPVHELVNYLAGAVGGFCWDEGNGVWRMKVEKPETPSMVFTKENIIGEFVYQHTEFDSRYNRLTGVFRNEDNLYSEDRVSVFDQADIDATGTRHSSVALVGCTNRQEALRRLKIRLLTGLHETKIVTFTTNRMGLLLEPFSTIAIADADLNADTALRSTGRILSLNTARTQIGLRDTIRLELGVSYKLHVTVPNTAYTPEASSQPTSSDWRKPTITITRNITNTSAQRGDVKTVYLDQALPANVPANANFALEAVGLPALPKSYRVTNLQLSDGNPDQVVITATEIYANKWTESDNVVENEFVSQSVSKIVPPPVAPATGMFSTRQFTSTIGKQRFLVVNWNRPVSSFVDDFKVEYSYNNGAWQDFGFTRETYYELPEPLQGNHQFRIYTRDRRGALSDALTGSTDLSASLLIVPTPVLTNAAATVDATAAGVVSDFSPAGGAFQLRYPSGPITSGVTYSVLSVTGGLALTISESGTYTVTALTSDTGTAVLRAVYDGQTFDQVYSLSKARAGAGGAAGLNTASVALFQRTTTNVAPAVANTGSATYTFATGAITGQPANWSAAVPAASNGGYLWVIRATASATTATDAIANTEWSTPVLFAQDGAAGAAGADAPKTALVYIYQRAASAPALPSVAATYTFATNTVSGLNNGWTTTIPTGTAPLYVSTATASGTGATDAIANTEWSTPVVLAQNGTDGTNGTNGANGLNSAAVELYQRTTTNTAPTVATSGNATYTFATGGITGQPAGWTGTIPSSSNGSYLWVIRATAAATSATDTIANTEWTTPVLFAQDGSQGPAGADAPKTALVYIYKRSASAPAVPSVATTYTFATNTLAGLDNGWTSTIPAGTDPLYVSIATASSTGTTDSIAANEWSSPVILAKDGTNGTNGTNGANGLNTASVSLYQRTATNTAPTVSATGTATYTFATGAITGQPSGWSTDIPAISNGGFLWVIRATASSSSATDAIVNTEWSTPILLVQNGSDAPKVALVYIYRRSASAPAVPSVEATYTFATNALSGLNNSWTSTIPAGTDPLYVAVATASGSGTTDTISTTDWSTPTILAQNGTNGTNGINSAVVTLYQRTTGTTAPTLATTGTATYTFATGAIVNQPSGWSRAIPSNASGGYLWAVYATAIGSGTTDDIANTEWSTPVVISQDGVGALTSVLQPETRQINSYANGGVSSYSGISTTMVLLAGSTDVSSSFTLTVQSNPNGLTTSISGRTVTVTGAGSAAGQFGNTAVDTASITIRATGSGAYSGTTIDKVFTLTKAKGGYEIVASLPTDNLFEGRIVFLSADDKLYRYDGTAWTKSVDGEDISAGSITAAKLAVTDLSSISANIGTLTAGTIRNTADTYRVDVTNGRTIAQNGGFMKVTGAPFGSSNQFIEWYGPYFASLSSCTENNASFFLKTNGDAYFGGSLSAGTLKNSAQTSLTDATAAVTVGPFGSNGSPIQVVTSYYASSYTTQSYLATQAALSQWQSAVTTWGGTYDEFSASGSKAVSCNVVVRVDRLLNGVTTTGWSTLTITSATETIEGSPPEPIDNTQGWLRFTRTVSGSITTTDNSGTTNTRTFTATLTTRTNATYTQGLTQRIGIVCTEQ